MALAILLGGIVGLIVAGSVLAIGVVRQGRRDQDDINGAFAKAWGKAQDPDVGPAPWSSFDMEALVEDGVAIDRSDPYATLTNSQISWSESTLEDGHAPLANVAPEPDENFVAEPDKTFVPEPDDTFVAEPDDAFIIAEPDKMFAAAPNDTFVAQPDKTFVADPDKTFVAQPDETVAEPDETVAEPDETIVPEPVHTLFEPVSYRAAPQRIDEDQPVVWRAPAQSQVIILVVALRALADGVAATVAPEAWGSLDYAVAGARPKANQGENGYAGRSSIDVDAHDRPVSENRSGVRVTSDDHSRTASAPRRSTPRRSTPRRHNGPKPISWRARPY
jgi:hypothetical protein